MRPWRWLGLSFAPALFGPNWSLSWHQMASYLAPDWRRIDAGVAGRIESSSAAAACDLRGVEALVAMNPPQALRVGKSGAPETT